MLPDATTIAEDFRIHSDSRHHMPDHTLAGYVTVGPLHVEVQYRSQVDSGHRLSDYTPHALSHLIEGIVLRGIHFRVLLVSGPGFVDLTF